MPNVHHDPSKSKTETSQTPQRKDKVTKVEVEVEVIGMVVKILVIIPKSAHKK